MKIGLDVGSTTLKCVVIDDFNNIVFKRYERHYSEIAQKTSEMLYEMLELFPETVTASLCISGSAGMGLAEGLELPFAQEVYATRTAVRSKYPEADVVIELGGEDAKILFVSDMPEVRMNGSCAGGTGAFIDQMATLIGVTPEEMNALAKEHERIHTIASRCGVFGKSDIQALLNQGAKKQDIAASIFYAVVNQTVAGLAQGRDIKGNILYLGGPMTFFPELRRAFDDVLGTVGYCPDDSLYFVAMGAAMTPALPELDIEDAAERIGAFTSKAGYRDTRPLFGNLDEYTQFMLRHGAKPVNTDARLSENGRAWIGVDAGSTTVKCVAINEDEDIFFSRYIPNSGNPVPLVLGFLRELYAAYPEIVIMGAASTGYGEEIIKSAFCLDMGIVETVAHFTAAKKFEPEVDLIIDIGGQDIKCFKVRNGAIDNIFLNEACSSGCGSFLQSFAAAWGYKSEEFALLGLFAEKPADLGSRCTVFMNSAVKQAQKDGADIGCISAGLCMSVVKNALYKVIRAARPEDLGEHIVVQGGTFLNDAVLRAFEMEIGRDVTRPSISGLMGAYGAALCAKEEGFEESQIISRDGLTRFTHEVRPLTCGGCTNNCALTVNNFDGERRYIAGNRCDKPVAGASAKEHINMYEYKRNRLAKYVPIRGSRGIIGIPMGLNMFEMLPFWHSFFTTLGFEVITSPESNRSLYFEGQHSIPSDTVCYPAKLIHGHIEYLKRCGVDAIFYPCLSYNFDEGLGDNHFNCPVVAYYPEVIGANMPELSDTMFIADYIGIHRREDFTKKMRGILAKYWSGISLQEVRKASDKAYAEYERYMADVRAAGAEYLRRAREKGQPVIVLAGRPYHIDREINHGIDQLICGLGAAVISEETISDIPKFKVGVLNQWTYHSRMYAAAKVVVENEDMNLVQLVSFGCGVDAVTADEVCSILEESGQIYTQIKIDEIENLGAVKIRLRSLFAASGHKGKTQR